MIHWFLVILAADLVSAGVVHGIRYALRQRPVAKRRRVRRKRRVTLAKVLPIKRIVD